MRQRVLFFLTLVPLLLFANLAMAQDPGAPDVVKFGNVTIGEAPDTTIQYPIYLNWDEDNIFYAGLVVVQVPFLWSSSDISIDITQNPEGQPGTAGIAFISEDGDTSFIKKDPLVIPFAFGLTLYGTLPTTGMAYAQGLSVGPVGHGWAGDGTDQFFGGVYFSIPAAAPDQVITFDTTFAPPGNSVILIDAIFPPASWTPQVQTGSITLDRPSDNLKPEITCPGAVTVEIGEPVNIAVTATDDGLISAPLVMTASGFPGFTIFTDNLDNSANVAGTPGCADDGVTEIVFIANDGELADTCSVTLTVNPDTQDPVLTCPGADIQVVNDPGTCGAVVNLAGSATATDNCPGVTVSYEPASGSTFPVGTTAVTATATDAAGNTATCGFNVVVTDTEDPVAICPLEDIVVSNDPGTCGAVVEFGIDASDNCAGYTVEADVASGSTFPVGTTLVTVTATDGAGNTNVCTFNVTVNDTEDPVAICPDDIIVGNDPGTCGAVVQFAIDATDNCAGYTVEADVASGATFPLGTTLVTVTATDGAGNTNVCTFNVTVNDTEDPIITCPPDVAIGPTDPIGPEFTGYATAIDNCDGDPTIAYSDVQVGDVITRTWTATDNDGNSASCDQIITISEANQAPQITCAGSQIVAEGDQLTFDVTATDPNAGDVVTVTFEDVPGGSYTYPTFTWTPACEHIGNYNAMFIASDGDLADTCFVNIDVVDGDDPVITCPADVQVACGDPTDPASTGEAVATDNCDPAPGIAYEDAVTPGACPQEYFIERTWTATDAAGNTAECIQTITVVDGDAPVITCPPDVAVNEGDPTGPEATGYATATDNCDAAPDVNYVDENFSDYIERTWTATDDCANESSCVQTITIEGAQCDDWCRVGDASGTVGSTVTVPVTFKNCVDLGGAAIPLRWSQDVVTLDAIDFTGSRVDYLVMKSDPSSIDNGANTAMLFAVVMSEAPIPAGEGLFANLIFTIDDCADGPVFIDTAFIPPSGYYVFSDPAGDPVPTAFEGGAITVEPGDLDVILDPTSFDFEATIGGGNPACQPLNITTDYCGDAGWTLSWQTDWLDVTPTEGVFPGSADVCVNIEGLAPGAYIDTICVNPVTIGAAVVPYCAVVTLIVHDMAPMIVLDNGYIRFTVTNCEGSSTDDATVNITNGGGGDLNWTADWIESFINVVPSAGTAPSALTISVDALGYPADTYMDTIIINGDGATNSPQYILVETTVEDCPQGDTVWVGDGAGGLGDIVTIPVTFANTQSLSGITVPLMYSSDHVVCIGGDFTGSRVEYLDQKFVTIDEVARTICIAAIPMTEALIPAGPEGLLVNLKFGVISTEGCPSPVFVQIDSNYVPPGCEFMFTDQFANPVYPEFFDGQIEIGCPGGISGTTLEDDLGNPIPGCVEVWDSYPDGSIIGRTCAGGDGRFEIAPLPDGDYDIRIVLEGYCTYLGEVTSPASVLIYELHEIPTPAVTPFVADYWGTGATLYGYSLQPGDVITAEDPDGVVCGVAYVDLAGEYSIHVYGDDTLTTPGVDEGAVGGDEITFYLNCDCPLTADNLWTNHGFFNEDLAFECVRDQHIELCGDWTLISYNVAVEDQSLQNVLFDIDGQYEQLITSICDYGAATWDVSRPDNLNDLAEMDNDHGYWLYAPGALELVITGVPVPPATPIELCADWNVISYLPNKADDMMHAFGSIGGMYTYAFGWDCRYGAQTYDPQRPDVLNDLTCLYPGHGYWVKMSGAATLTYPTSGYECDVVTPLPKAVNLTNVVKPTPWVSDFWSYGSANGPAEGTILSVRDEHGILCGQSIVLEDGMFLVHVYGDDPKTEADEGAITGSRLTFESDGVEYEVLGSDTWTERVSSEITLSRPGGTAPVPNAYELSQNYPNPFNPKTTIRFKMPDNLHVNISVFNVLGQKVRTLLDEFKAAGEHEVEWDGAFDNGNEAESGVYFYRITTKAFTDVKKMTLLK